MDLAKACCDIANHLVAEAHPKTRKGPALTVIEYTGDEAKRIITEHSQRGAEIIALKKENEQLRTKLEELEEKLTLAKEALQEIAGETEDKGLIRRAREALEELN